MTKIAVLSDIHGNSEALKALFKDLDKREVDLIFNLGDILYGPLDPMGTFELLQSRNIISISGNQDRIILENIDKETNLVTLKYVLNELNKEVIHFLKSLSFDYKHDTGIYLCHATPQKDDEYLLENLFSSHVSLKDNNEIEEILETIAEKIVVCGHSHQPRVLKTKGRTIINPGSVGLQAYDDDLPIFHRMQNFSPDARYSILHLNNVNNISAIEQIVLPYDYELAARQAENNNRPDWAKWIRTGRA